MGKAARGAAQLAYSAALATCPQPRCRAERAMEQKPAPMRARLLSRLMRPTVPPIALALGLAIAAFFNADPCGQRRIDRIHVLKSSREQ